MDKHPILNVIKHICCREATKMLFGSIFTPHLIKKNKSLILPNQENTLYFLSTGLLRLAISSVSAKQENELHTIRFYQPSTFFTPPRYIDQQHPCYEIVALVDSFIYQTNYEMMEKIYHMAPDIAILILDLQNTWNKDFNDEKSLLQRPALQRLDFFIQKVGINHLNIPKKHLASYLLISPKHLGRLSRQLLNRK